MQYFLSDIATITGGQLVGYDIAVSSVLTDSRRSLGVDEKPMFVAIRGALHDGHDYLENMYERGVRAFLVEQQPHTEHFSDVGFVVVPNTIRALQALAADWRGKFTGKIIGISGSRGKTAVKELIADALSPKMKIFRSPRSYNSQLGVPLSILMMSGEEDVAIIEAGISRRGEMGALAKIIRPDIGVFTGLGVEHAENFESDDEKYAEKMLLFADAKQVIGGREAVSPEILATELCRTLGVAVTVQSQPLLDYNISEGIYNSIIVNDPENSDLNTLSLALDYVRGVAGESEMVVVMTDVKYSQFTDRELYARMGSIVHSSGVALFVGVGEKISAHADNFAGVSSKFFTTARDAVANLFHSDLEHRAVLLRGDIPTEPQRLLHFLERRSHTTVLNVNLDAIVHNINTLRSQTGNARLIAMVKASSYGNGDYEIANLMAQQGVDYLAVAFADEGVQLREKGIAMPIIVLNGDEDNFELMLANRLEPEIYNFHSLNEFARAVEARGEAGYPVHLKIDSGMHRWGFEMSDVHRLNALLEQYGGVLVVRSIFSHLAAADDYSEDSFTRSQITRFQQIADAISAPLHYRPLRHIANTAAAIRFPEAQMDICRLGLGLYGFGAANLHPVSTLTTRIMQLREVRSGDTVGYGREGKITETQRLATLPIGYADGLDRRLGNGRWSVLVNAKSCPTVGRISMDSCVVNVTDVRAVEGDEAVIFSSAAGNTIADMARTLDTIPYEIMTSIATRVKRIYIKE